MPDLKQQITRKITYGVKELQELVMNDLHSKGIKWDDTAVITLKDRQIQTGTVPLGQFDEDIIYGFGGLEITIEEK